MYDDLAALLEAALNDHGKITITLGPIDSYEAIYDHKTKILRVDPDADILAAVVGVLRDVVYGPPDRQLAVLAGGATACGMVPEQPVERPRTVRHALRVVRDAG